MIWLFVNQRTQEEQRKENKHVEKKVLYCSMMYSGTTNVVVGLDKAESWK